MFGSNGPRLTQVSTLLRVGNPALPVRKRVGHIARARKPTLIAGRSNQTWWFMFVSFVRCLLIPARSNDARVGRRRSFWSRRWRKRVCGSSLFGLNSAFFAHATLPLRNFTRILRKVQNFCYFFSAIGAVQNTQGACVFWTKAPGLSSKIRKLPAYFGRRQLR